MIHGGAVPPLVFTTNAPMQLLPVESAAAYSKSSGETDHVRELFPKRSDTCTLVEHAARGDKDQGWQDRVRGETHGRCNSRRCSGCSPGSPHKFPQ